MTCGMVTCGVVPFGKAEENMEVVVVELCISYHISQSRHGRVVLVFKKIS